MRDEGIFDGDLIGVHRTTDARSGQIVVARIDDEITVKLLKIGKDRIRLLPRNPDYAPIEVQPGPGLRDRGPVLRPGAAEPVSARAVARGAFLTADRRPLLPAANVEARCPPRRSFCDAAPPNLTSSTRYPTSVPRTCTMDENKKRALTAALGQIDKQFGKGSVMRMGDQSVEVVEVIGTGSLMLDIALGIGGLPKGRVVEIYGPESSGKTTLTLQVIAECQKAGGTAAFVDAEHALDPIYAQKLGVNLDDLLRLAAGHRRAGAGDRRHAGALERGRHGGDRLGRRADPERRNRGRDGRRCCPACRRA